MAILESPSGPKLLQQAEKILLHPIHPNLISYCPTMDLIAVVTDEENLDVYRINGQKAFGLKRKSEDNAIDFICWEFNGQAIAVAWSDGYTDILSAETGKVIHKDLPPPSTGTRAPRISCIGWSLNFINVEAVKQRTGLRKWKTNGSGPAIDFVASTTEDWDAFKDGTTLEDFLQRQPDLQTLDIAPDLPDQLAMMDMETLLPKLPVIPLPPALPFMRAPQADSGAFSSQANVDSLLHSHHTKDHNSVDMFIRCTDEGTVHPSIYDSLETVNVRLPSAWGVKSRPILHTNHPYSCSHGLLVETRLSSSSQKKLAFVPLTLGFIPSAGIYLHLIASKTSQLQNLLLYVQQTLQRIRTYFKHSQDLPSKFMMNISETLVEKGHGDLVTNLYHLACTGNCPPLIHEWLVDELAEQGHKRWDNTVTSSLTTLLALLHENFLPALDRCSIVISRLRGLAQYHDQEWIFSGPITDFTSLLEILKTLRLLAHTCILYASDEKRQFHSFSRWLRFCIDFEATEPDSQSRAEMEGRDPGVDIGMVLEYIRYGLTKSDLKPYLRGESELGDGLREKEAASYDDTRKAIDLLKEDATFKEEALCLDHVLSHFGERVIKLLKQVSQWQEKNIRMDCGIILEEENSDDEAAMDMRMVFEPSASDPETISTYIAVSSPNQPFHLNIHRLTHAPTVNSILDALHEYSISLLNFSAANARVLDAKFADDKNLLVLTQLSDAAKTCLIMSLPYTPTSTSQSTASPITYTPLPGLTIPSLLLPHGDPIPMDVRSSISITTDMMQKHTRHVFEGRFTPLKLIVNGRKGRRVVVVLGSDRKHYRVLDLDFKERKSKGEEEKYEQADEEDYTDSDIEMGGA